VRPAHTAAPSSTSPTTSRRPRHLTSSYASWAVAWATTGLPPRARSMAVRTHPSLDGILDRAVLVRMRRRAPDEQVSRSGAARPPRTPATCATGWRSGWRLTPTSWLTPNRRCHRAWSTALRTSGRRRWRWPTSPRLLAGPGPSGGAEAVRGAARGRPHRRGRPQGLQAQGPPRRLAALPPPRPALQALQPLPMQASDLQKSRQHRM
jgi:hypothetical protein